MSADYQRAEHYVLSRLACELSPQHTYHSIAHTRDDVVPAARRLGGEAGLDEPTLLLLVTAAAYHDVGFLYDYRNHERESIAVARAVLPRFGYDAGQIDAIADLIAATRMPQRPATPLQELICDADLDVLGREDFWLLNRKLLAEVRHFSERPIDEAAWLRDQTRFLEEHRYFSAAAHALRDEGKTRNIVLMRRALSSLNGSAVLHADS